MAGLRHPRLPQQDTIHGMTTPFVGVACLPVLAGVRGWGRARGDRGARAAAPTTSAAPAPEVSFTAPSDGAAVTSPVTVTMTASNFTVEPAGEVHAGAGHLHV